jgi:hypothetical protein
MARRQNQPATPDQPARDPDGPRYGAPDPAPEVGEAVRYIRPDPRPPEDVGTTDDKGRKVEEPEPFVKIVDGRVTFVHPDTETTKLEGRVVNLEFSTAKGPQPVLNVPFYPLDVMEEEKNEMVHLIGNTWHRK